MHSISTLTLNPTIDKHVETPQVQPDTKLRCAPPRFEPGGGGVNVSRAIQRLGGQSTAVMTCGGPLGDLLHLMLDDEGVTTEAVTIEGWTRENFIARDTERNEQYRFGLPGPELSKQEWQQALKVFEKRTDFPNYIVASGSLPPGVPDNFYAQLARICHERDARLIVDTSKQALQQALAAGLFLLKPNVRELNQLLGEELQGEQQQIEAARQLIGQGQCQAIFLSLGAGGALLVTNNDAQHFRAPTVPIQSKIGAGDSTVAGLVLALSRGESLSCAARWGMAAGAAAVMTPGTELCRREDAERLFAEMATRSKD